MKISKNIKRFPKRTIWSGGFTLIEILIVVILLGVLASIVVPGLSNTNTETKKAMLLENLRVIREQIAIYRVQHDDVSPGYPAGDVSAAPSEEDFIAQLTGFTDIKSNPSDTKSMQFRFGSYLRKIPENPINGLSTVLVVANQAEVPQPDNSVGWIYKPADQIFIPGTVILDG
jgi:general secretion pathway protein G